MPRWRRTAAGGRIYDSLNRANARLAIFASDDDYAAFERVLHQAVARFDVRLLVYCLTPNHFHLLLWPHDDGNPSTFMRWLTMTHTLRWHAHHRTAGAGHLYQGRYRSFPVQSDEHFLIECPLRRTERAADKLGRTRGAVEVREPVGSSDQGRGGATDLDPLADRTSA
jgi:putative transposase